MVMHKGKGERGGGWKGGWRREKTRQSLLACSQEGKPTALFSSKSWASCEINFNKLSWSRDSLYITDLVKSVFPLLLDTFSHCNCKHYHQTQHMLNPVIFSKRRTTINEHLLFSRYYNAILVIYCCVTNDPQIL